MLAPSLDYIKRFPQFICYQIVRNPERREKADKHPVSPDTGYRCDGQASANWMTYETAAAAAASARLKWNGDYRVGFVLTPECKLFVLDIDGALMPDRKWHPLVSKIRTALSKACVEVSVSNTGIHYWGRYEGPEPEHACTAYVEGIKIELYTSKRFIALGDQITAVGDAGADCTLELHEVIAQYFPESAATSKDAAWSEGPCEEWTEPISDDELLRRALNSNSAAARFGNDLPTFRDLWGANAAKLGARWPDGSGRGRAYDESSADMALAQHFAWWTRSDCARIEQIMRRPDCGLLRPKWDRRRTYLRNTIMKAVALQEGFYGDNRTPAAGAQRAAYVPAATVADMAAVVADSPDKGEALQLMMQLGTQDSIAGAFATLYAGKLKFDHSRKKWHMWDGSRWQEDDKKRVFDLVVNLCREKNREGKSSMGSASFAHGVEDLASSRPSLAVSGSEWNLDNYLLNTPAGTVDLSTGMMRSHDSKDMLTLCTAASPDALGDGAAFRKFMLEITAGDEELIRFHQLSLGACLSGAVEGHWLLFWYGVPRAGKNTLGELVEALMGDYARTIPTSTLMSKKFEGHPTEMANLQGVRLATSSELSDGDHWNEARIKQLTGDATLSARWIGGNFFEFDRNFKLLVYGNYKPQLRSADEALRTRLKIVPFKVSFLDREDADLPGRLRAEMGYVLQWLIEGHRQWWLPARSSRNARL